MDRNSILERVKKRVARDRPLPAVRQERKPKEIGEALATSCLCNCGRKRQHAWKFDSMLSRSKPPNGFFPTCPFFRDFPLKPIMSLRYTAGQSRVDIRVRKLVPKARPVCAQLTRAFSAAASSRSSTSSSTVRMMRSRGVDAAALHFVGDGGLVRLRCRSMVFRVVLLNESVLGSSSVA